MWLSNVEHKDVLLCVKLALEFFNRDLRDAVDDGMLGDRFIASDLEWADLTRRRDAAELVVVDQFGHSRVGAADRALRIFAQLQRAEAHAQGVDQEKSADQRLTDAKDQLDRLGALDHADQA